ncbi:uncharacterized protein LOC120840195 [Ixodes scapularis]|uniref:uncharacterized protein LOC120840195 n=1 Tax=Ixodes scapularis TaxID=6945 RepID=UPI001A9DD9AC|nr:uncharacterized protein LOC120840195 [Ixodes scapularis]
MDPAVDPVDPNPAAAVAMDVLSCAAYVMYVLALQTSSLSTFSVDIRSARRKADLLEEELLANSVLLAAAAAASKTDAVPRSVQAFFGLGRSTVNELYKEFCTVVVSALEPEWVKMVGAAELSERVREFEATLDFPQAIGALDGCHFPVSPPQADATDYRNYKGWSALAGILEGPTFQKPMITINGTAVPPVILCDQVFPLTPNLLKPYPRKDVTDNSTQAGFNKRLSAARKIVENAIGRVKARFRLILKRMECDVNNARLIVRAFCVLNNICEHFNDGVEAQWLRDAERVDSVHIQPVCATDIEADSGQRIRNAIAVYLHQRSRLQH